MHVVTRTNNQLLPQCTMTTVRRGEDGTGGPPVLTPTFDEATMRMLCGMDVRA